MKKLLALTLALLMALTCMSAFADTIYTDVSVDGDVAKTLLTGFGVPEDQLAMVDPILSLVNALGVKVITVADGAQVDLDLNGAEALSLGVAMNEQGTTVASTLFPNYVLTVSQETIGQIMAQMSASMPSAGGEGGMDMNAMMEVFGGYYQRWFEACAAAAHPGEPVTGEYEFEGHTFDTMVPVEVDISAIAEATKSLMDEMMADPAAMAMIQGMAQSMAQRSGQAFDEAEFTEKFKAGFDEWMAHFPDTTTAEVYTNSDGSGAFYMTAESVREGQEEPFTCDMLFVDQTHMSMNYQDGQTTQGGFDLDGTDMGLYFVMGETYFGLAISFPENQFAMDIYFVDAEKPLVSITVDTAKGGERTLSMDAEGKTVLAVEDVMNDQTGETVQGLMGDIMGNGLGSLMGVLSEQVPEIAGLLSMFSGAMMAS